MPKLSDPGYFLPEIEMLEPGKVMSSGRTSPMLIRGVCVQNGKRGEYIVKLKGSPEMYPGSSLKEVLSSFIALELDLQAPEPVAVNISNDTIDLMQGHDNHKLSTLSLGFNFGSEYKTGYQQIVETQPISDQLRTSLCELFAFDVFLGNPDRRREKHNFLTNGKDLLIFDHEMAFSFTSLLSFARNPSPWTIIEPDLEWLKLNFCYHRLKGNDIDFSNFTARLDVINEAFWEKAKKVIPGDWQHKDFDVIKDYLNSIVQHKDEFASELNRILQ